MVSDLTYTRNCKLKCLWEPGKGYDLEVGQVLNNKWQLTLSLRVTFLIGSNGTVATTGQYLFVKESYFKNTWQPILLESTVLVKPHFWDCHHLDSRHLDFSVLDGEKPSRWTFLKILFHNHGNIWHNAKAHSH